jgi:hypothetical protein
MKLHLQLLCITICLTSQGLLTGSAYRLLMPMAYSIHSCICRCLVNRHGVLTS